MIIAAKKTLDVLIYPNEMVGKYVHLLQPPISSSFHSVGLSFFLYLVTPLNEKYPATNSKEREAT